MDWRNVLKRIFQGLTMMSVLGGAVLLYALKGTQEEMSELHNKVTFASSEVIAVEEDKQPIGILLLGVDEWENDVGDLSKGNSRSDAIMVASVNPKTKRTEIVTIPRDTLVEIRGSKNNGILDKVNHAYAFGGVDQSIATVSNYLDIPIHYYATINMSGIEELVNAVGGVEVTPSLSFSLHGNDFKEGISQTLLGDEALAYMRMRKDDPRGDVGRGVRQQEVIKAIITKTATPEGILGYQKILNALGNNLETNVPISLGMIRGYYKAFEELNMSTIENQEDYRINNIYYSGVSEVKRKETSNLLRENLGLIDSGVNHSDYLEDARIGNLRR